MNPSLGLRQRILTSLNGQELTCRDLAARLGCAVAEASLILNSLNTCGQIKAVGTRKNMGTRGAGRDLVIWTALEVAKKWDIRPLMEAWPYEQPLPQGNLRVTHTVSI